MNQTKNLTINAWLLQRTIDTRENTSLETNNSPLFYVIVKHFLVPSPLEAASNFSRGVARGLYHSKNPRTPCQKSAKIH